MLLSGTSLWLKICQIFGNTNQIGYQNDMVVERSIKKSTWQFFFNIEKFTVPDSPDPSKQPARN